MYLITDTYGTRKTAWTWRAALDWLAYCSPEAVVTHRLTGKVMASRVWTRPKQVFCG